MWIFLSVLTAEKIIQIMVMMRWNIEISTNPGESRKPLGQIVSGGELSRIMLAIKAILADKDQIDTLIFDEIDTGISGRTAQKVSEKNGSDRTAQAGALYHTSSTDRSNGRYPF